MPEVLDFRRHFDESANQPALNAKEIEDAAQLVDTALFRAYMLTAPSLVGSLVRVDNKCDPKIVEEALITKEVCYLVVSYDDIQLI